MNYKYIIWDWNGTLLDDVGPALDAVNDMLEKRNMSAIDIETYRERIGVPIKKFYERTFDLEKEDYNSIIAEWNRLYKEKAESCSLSDGAIECLEYFAEKGKTQIIVSSSNNAPLIAGITKFGISSYFDAVLGSDDFLADSKIDRAVKYLDSHSDGGKLVIGDLEHDKDLADALGADCVLLSSGHEKRSRLEKSGARVIDSLRELIEK